VGDDINKTSKCTSLLVGFTVVVIASEICIILSLSHAQSALTRKSAAVDVMFLRVKDTCAQSSLFTGMIPHIYSHRRESPQQSVTESLPSLVFGRL